jgi:uncharacterized integral membrane protein
MSYPVQPDPRAQQAPPSAPAGYPGAAAYPSEPGYPDAGAYPPPAAYPPPSAPTGAAADPPTVGEPAPGMTKSGRVRPTRVSAAWVGAIVAAVVLIVLLIFIAQNSQRVTIRFLGFDGRVSLAIGLVLAAIAGVLLVAIPGTARILQLRRALRKNAGSRARR